jgi:hypothetical protein
MSDSPSNDSENPDAPPVNERPTSFIDGATYLEFVRLKSLVTPKDGSPEKNDVFAMPDVMAADINAGGHGHSVCYPDTTADSDSRIDTEDWDSLFEAVEQRLRDTVEKPDLTATPLGAQYNVWRVKSVVLDCVSALGKLHKALRQERSTHAPHQTNAVNSDNSVALPLTNGHGADPNNQPR